MRRLAATREAFRARSDAALLTIDKSRVLLPSPQWSTEYEEPDSLRADAVEGAGGIERQRFC
jgi:hypothetical protein